MHVLWRGDTLQRLRLVSGLILFSFALHALHQSRARPVQHRHDAGGAAVALGGHALLAGHDRAARRAPHPRLARRSTSSLAARRCGCRAGSWCRSCSALSIPFLLLPHIVNTRIAHVYFGVNDIYVYELARLWPASAIIQSLLLVIVWVHGCMGIHFWLRLLPAVSPRRSRCCWRSAVIIPLAALGGFTVAGSDVAAAIEVPSVFANLKVLTRWPERRRRRQARLAAHLVRFEFGGGAGGRDRLRRLDVFRPPAGPKVTVAYTAGPTVKVPQGPTLLEISAADARCRTPSVCGGRARCSTCRVRIERGPFTLAAAGFPESVTLGSIGAPPNVRLACQIRPEHYLVVTRLLKSEAPGRKRAADRGGGFGRRREIAGRHVRRPARLHPPVRKAAAVRHRVTCSTSSSASSAPRSPRTAAGSTSSSATGCSPYSASGRASRPGAAQALRTARDIDLALDRINATARGRDRAPARGRHRRRCRPAAARPHRLRRRGGLHRDRQSRQRRQPAGGAAKEKEVQLILSREVARERRLGAAGGDDDHVKVRGVAEPIEVIGVSARPRSAGDDTYFRRRRKGKARRVDCRGQWAAGVAPSAARSSIAAPAY